MNKTDDVFFFTLIDFLIQVVFFGLLLFVAYQSSNKEQQTIAEKNNHDISTIFKISGTSNLTELTDYLTKLAPIKHLIGNATFFKKNKPEDIEKLLSTTGFSSINEMVDFFKTIPPINDLKRTLTFISENGGVSNIETTMGMIKTVGGYKVVQERLEKLRKLEGRDKPPCLYEMKDGQRNITPLAVVTAKESSIRFDGTTEQLNTVLTMINTNFDDIQELSLNNFERIFSQVTNKKPECRYTLIFKETTRFVEPRDAAGRYFYLAIRKP